jgi:hypothetical protein
MMVRFPSENNSGKEIEMNRRNLYYGNTVEEEKKNCSLPQKEEKHIYFANAINLQTGEVVKSVKCATYEEADKKLGELSKELGCPSEHLWIISKGCFYFYT